eukprot:CAMPEP_0184686758 /NCGR_PEP_ID=MMETSP0312-20130426/23883_1 /TAXON_ID=31354 /ORGANISM="Compsopogon coeruleus, Strain SAG 36.94" /LENGTH=80 /DNA_ID=CAMNT_0027142203 /DNA_START=455 /DNA_END=697 /DNA_ORIENTATION=+
MEKRGELVPTAEFCELGCEGYRVFVGWEFAINILLGFAEPIEEDGTPATIPTASTGISPAVRDSFCVEPVPRAADAPKEF